jgi:hypothetical protein
MFQNQAQALQLAGEASLMTTLVQFSQRSKLEDSNMFGRINLQVNLNCTPVFILFPKSKQTSLLLV